MHIIVNLFINKIIRKNIYLYIFFIFIYKRFSNLFLFIEKDSYSFIKNSRINNIVDVGSNHFQIAKIILSLCKNRRIKIFSYDPIPQDDFVTPKIDAEGYELPIIKGAIKSIKKNNPIILLDVNKNFNKIKKILSRMGYQTYLYNTKSKKFIRIKELKNKFNDVFFLNEGSLLL